jgi:hypothetical protein
MSAIVARKVTAVTAVIAAGAHGPGAMKFDSQGTGAAPPDWTYSVQKPVIFSPLWVLYMLSKLSIPIAIIGVIAAARYLGWIALD